jgi:hypothetical protein
MLLPYLVLSEHGSGGLVVVIGLAPLTARQVAESFWATHTPRSGGYCHLFPDHAAQTLGALPDLGLAPHPQDGVLLFAQARATVREACRALSPATGLGAEIHRAPLPA